MYSAFRSRSGRAPLNAAAMPVAVMNPPTAAPLANDQYRKRRNPRNGATDSSKSLLDTLFFLPSDVDDEALPSFVSRREVLVMRVQDRPLLEGIISAFR